MSTTVYSYSLRMLACENCGAPIELSVEGGQVQCSYCQARHLVQRRDDRADQEASQQALAAAGSESERLDRLRGQDRGAMPLPQGLAPLLAGRDLAPEKIAAASSEWLLALRRVKQGAPFAEADRLFHLTLLLRPHLDDRRARAFIESAKEVLSDPRHRQVLRCILAHRAVIARDLSAADQWLQACNPRPVDLLMDTAYRLACCYIATARQDLRRVLSLLGYRPDDVPIADDREPEALILRANALESTGQAQQAHQQLVDVQRADPRFIHLLNQVVETNRPLVLCPSTFPPARKQVLDEVDAQLRPDERSLFGAVFWALFSAVLWSVTFAAVIGGGIVGGNWTAAGAIGSNAGIWAAVALGLSISSARKRRRINRIRREGVLSFAHVGASTKQVHSTDESTTVFHDLDVTLFEAGGLRPIKLRVERNVAPVPGIYPILLDPEEPDRSILKL